MPPQASQPASRINTPLAFQVGDFVVDYLPVLVSTALSRELQFAPLADPVLDFVVYSLHVPVSIELSREFLLALLTLMSPYPPVATLFVPDQSVLATS